MKKVYITAYSAVSALGVGIDETLKSLSNEKQDINFPNQNNKFHRPFFLIKSPLDIDEKKIRCSQLAIKLLRLIEGSWINKGSISIFGGTSTGGIKETEEAYLDLVNKKSNYPLLERHFFGKIFEDIKEEYRDKIIDNATFSTACSSSGHSVLEAYRFIKAGIIDRAIVMGVDVLSWTTMVGFDSLKLVSSTGTKPLTLERDGLTLGEGGGILLLEADPGENPIAEIMGGHSTTDGYHISSPDPEGTQQKICVCKTLEGSGVDKNEINYVSAHGTGTLINDEVEMKVVKTIFPEGITVSSLKAFIGHTLGASAITEIAITLGMLKEKTIYQPEGIGTPMDEKYIPMSTIKKEVKCFLKNSFGFGGNNVTLIIKNLL